MNIVAKEQDLTICSVSYSNSEFFELNSELISRLNANTSFNWVVVENSPNNTGNRLDSSDARFQIVEGVKKKRLIIGLQPVYTMLKD